MSERRYRGISIPARVARTAILGLAFLVRLVALDTQGLWRDEVDQWRFALQPWGEMLRNFIRAGWNGPLYSPLLRVWIALTGDSVFAMRYFSLLCGVLSVALLYVLAQRLLGEGTARWSALLMAISPYMVWYAQEVKMYTWVPLLVLLALYALDRACVHPHRRWWAVVWIATTLAFYSHLLAALLIPVEILWFWLHPRRQKDAWPGGVVTLALLTLPYLPMLRWMAPLLLVERQTGYPAYSLGEMAATLFGGWTLGVTQSLTGGPLPLYSALFLGMMALGGIVALAWRRRWGVWAQLWLWMLVPLLLLWLVSLRGPIFTDRYLIWAAPAFYVLAGVGLATIHAFRRWLSVILLLHVLVLNGIGLYRQAVYPIKPQFQRATSLIEAQRAPDELVLFQIPYNHYVVQYYAEEPLEPWGEAPFTNWKREDGSYQVDMAYVDEKMQALLNDYTGVWLIYSEVALWDDRELVKQWLDAHGHRVDQQPYTGVTVYHYIGLTP
ncbi:MAG TPA: glycosyltransferase family 39 protein [Anaerolineae bacterium]|nr:glycosyltransferase family 39 protein [Anaerolineae bacterium]HQH38089.1 glycosyltransferase family 39 protein [Anaerolineae bacterium]